MVNTEVTDTRFLMAVVLEVRDASMTNSYSGEDTLPAYLLLPSHTTFMCLFPNAYMYTDRDRDKDRQKAWRCLVSLSYRDILSHQISASPLRPK